MTQSYGSVPSPAINSSADANPRAPYPSEESESTSATRNDSSSSMTAIKRSLDTDHPCSWILNRFTDFYRSPFGGSNHAAPAPKPVSLFFVAANVEEARTSVHKLPPNERENPNVSLGTSAPVIVIESGPAGCEPFHQVLSASG